MSWWVFLFTSRIDSPKGQKGVIMAIVISRKIAIEFKNGENVAGKIFVKFPSKKALLKDPAYIAVNTPNEDDLEHTINHLDLVSKHIVGWEGIETEDGPMEFNEENRDYVAPLILEDMEAFTKFCDAMGGITEKK
jgi:hypothetical protein